MDGRKTFPLHSECKELLVFFSLVKGKSFPLEARGAQKVPGSQGSQIT